MTHAQLRISLPEWMPLRCQLFDGRGSRDYTVPAVCCRGQTQHRNATYFPHRLEQLPSD